MRQVFFQTVLMQLGCMTNLALLAKPRASGIMYIITSNCTPRSGENSIQDLDCLNLNLEFCHKISGKSDSHR